MIIIIPLGGKGERFKNLGYTKPKPLISVLGKEIICWLIDNLDLDESDRLIIPYNNELENYRFEEFLQFKYPKINFTFVKLEKQTEGAIETVLIACNKLFEEDKFIENNHLFSEEVMCVDGDNFFSTNIIKKYKENKYKNCVFTIVDKNTEPIYSYVKVNEKGHIIDMIEKQKISDFACCGIYCFRRMSDLINDCNYIIKNKIKQKGEYYMSGLIKLLIEKEALIDNIIIDNKDFICLGTPLQVKIFCNNIPKLSAIDKNSKLTIKKSRICFDLDNTLVTYPKISGDYSTVEPIQQNINFLKYLKNMGHTIIIHTARRMKTHSGNQGAVMRDIGKITFDSLEKLDIPYDEIYFGKPDADYYIDDKAVSCFNSLEKELGFYQSKIDPRSFNEIKGSTIETYIKTSNNKKLEGEIHWYNNIPTKIKDMFPIFIRYDEENYKWYEMEKINGISITKIYLSGDMQDTLFNAILGSIDRIHNSYKIENTDINIYCNYSNKLKERYNLDIFRYFEDSEKIYNKLLQLLENYEKNNRGQISVIHGDPVLMNIMINQFGKIKFIDMRGILGNQLSIYGDKFYDYAKLYQSLCGYDEVHEEHKINTEYKNKMKNEFEKYIIKTYSEEKMKEIKIITASLLFTLIPLHYDENNSVQKEKCQEYYSICKNILSKI